MLKNAINGTAGSRLGRLAWLGLIVVGIVFPLVTRPYVNFVVTLIMVTAVGVLGLNLLTGYSRIISIGHSAFFALGAYLSIVLANATGLPIIISGIVSLPICYAVGWLVGRPTLRLNGVFIALVTLSLGIAIGPILKRFESVTGGSLGLQYYIDEPPAWTGLADDQWKYYIVFVGVVIAFVFANNLVRNSPGRRLWALGDDETALRGLGTDLASFRSRVFAWSALYAGGAGVLYSIAVGYVSPESFPVTFNITLLAALVVGGLGRIGGALIGAAFVQVIPLAASSVDNSLTNVIFGALIIATLYFLPGGFMQVLDWVVGLVTRTKKRTRDGGEDTDQPQGTAQHAHN